MNDKTTNALWTERESFVSTESYHFESHNCLSDPSQKQPGETQRSTKRKWRRRAGFSSIIANAALLLAQQKLRARKQNSEPPAAPEELLHGQPFKITFELGSSQMCVLECMCLIYDPCSSVAVSPAIPADTRRIRQMESSFVPKACCDLWIILNLPLPWSIVITFGFVNLRWKQPPQIYKKWSHVESLKLAPLHTVRVRVTYKHVLRHLT